MQVDHVGIDITSCARALRFYVDVLGLKSGETVAMEKANIHYLYADGKVFIELFEPKIKGAEAPHENNIRTKIRHVAFDCRSLEQLGAVRARAAAQYDGVSEICEIKRLNLYSLLLHDPDGNEIELVYRPSL
ncbi:MAG: VOC family protein [Oscillospiraceae bacterium]|nr:VOC family protein [Oscillospiraceae bacterium]